MKFAYIVLVIQIDNILVFARCSQYSSERLFELTLSGERNKHTVEARHIYSGAELAVCRKYNVLVGKVLDNVRVSFSVVPVHYKLVEGVDIEHIVQKFIMRLKAAKNDTPKSFKLVIQLLKFCYNLGVSTFVGGEIADEGVVVNSPLVSGGRHFSFYMHKLHCAHMLYFFCILFYNIYVPKLSKWVNTEITEFA